MSLRIDRPTRPANPTPAPGTGPHLAQLEQVLTEVRDERMQRHPPAAASEGRVLQCATCGRTDRPTAEQLHDLARFGWPECCGKVMALTAEPAAAPGKERRGGSRRPAKPGVRAEIRRGCLGMGPDVGLALLDASADGLRVRLREPVRAGEETEIHLHPPDGPAIQTRGRIIWCRPAGGWAFLAGVRLRRRLTAEEVVVLVG